MDRLNKLGLVCVVLALFVAGCGKKKETKDNKKVASAQIPVLKEETENLLEDSDISDFAFADDEAAKADKQAKAEEPKKEDIALVAENDNIEVDDTVIPEEDDNSSSYAFKTVHFDFNKNSIRADQKPLVNEDVEIASNAVEQGKKVVIEGHCDQVGSASYNLALSQRRAESVKEAMVNKGIDKNEIKTVGYGYERPVVWSDAKDRSTLIKELAQNRRAEIVVN